MIAPLRELLSRTYFGNRARAGKVGRDRDIQEREGVFRSGRGAVVSLQLRKLRHLLCHAGAHVPYYRDLFRERGFDPNRVQCCEDLAALPALDKPAIRAAGDRMISEAAPRSSLRRNASGGSTGAPLQFVQGDDYIADALVTAPLFDMWTGWRRGEPVALVWGAPTDIARYGLFRERIRNTLMNRFLVDAFDMDSDKLSRAVTMLERRRPVLIVAYASAAYLLARYMRRNRITLEHPPRAVLCSAEVLWPHYRGILEAQFRCKVYNRYGSREVGMIAMECAHGTLHVNDTGNLVQVESPGEDGVGNLLITQLDNSAFPFIRYRIGDLGATTWTPCPCGRALSVLTGLRGRVSDYIVSPDGKVLHGEWFTHLFYDAAGVALFTFRQTSPSHYVFEVQRDEGFRSEPFERAIATARQRLGSRAIVDVVFVDRFEASPSGKHRFVINECPEVLREMGDDADGTGPIRELAACQSSVRKGGRA